MVTIALSEANFKKGHKIYDRVHDCFDRLSHLTFDLLLSWIPPGMTAQTDNISSFLRIIDTRRKFIQIVRVTFYDPSLCDGC